MNFHFVQTAIWVMPTYCIESPWKGIRALFTSSLPRRGNFWLQSSICVHFTRLGDQLKGEECLKRRREEVLPKVVDEEIRILVKGTCETRVASVRPSGKPYAIQVINI